MVKTSIPHTSEELGLFLMYLSLIGIWFAIPSVTLLVNKDERYPSALLGLATLVGVLFLSYILQWRVLFPTSASLVHVETYRTSKESDRTYECEDVDFEIL